MSEKLSTKNVWLPKWIFHSNWFSIFFVYDNCHIHSKWWCKIAQFYFSWCYATITYRRLLMLLISFIRQLQFFLLYRILIENFRIANGSCWNWWNEWNVLRCSFHDENLLAFVRRLSNYKSIGRTRYSKISNGSSASLHC